MPALTRDGVRIGLHINAGLKVDLPQLDQSGADGIGLFRTELEFMISARFPLKDRQTATYQAILDGAGERPVVFRTLDIGGDKLLPYMADRRGRKSGARLAQRTDDARPAGAVPHPDERAARAPPPAGRSR